VGPWPSVAIVSATMADLSWALSERSLRQGQSPVPIG
jgi:hypothetical protein